VRRLFFWFFVGAAIVAVSAIAWELVRLEPKLSQIPQIALVVLAPGYFISGWLLTIGAPEGYVLGALVNGLLYAFLAWLTSLVPTDKIWVRRYIVFTAFFVWWMPWIYFEFLAP
jgi:uncharacterized membrane protein YjjP (DUF1212 family)